jgi:hypothetical protein
MPEPGPKNLFLKLINQFQSAFYGYGYEARLVRVKR